MSVLPVIKLNLSDADDLASFLASVDKDFPVPLSSKVDIDEYAIKLLNRGFVVGARDEKGLLRGIAAGYANDSENLIAYLSVIAVAADYRGQGLSSDLLTAFESRSIDEGMASISLQTHSSNVRAIKFYQHMGYRVDSNLIPPYDNLEVHKLFCGLSRERPNILLTSVGRRAYLVEWFKDALDGNGEIFVVNSDSSTPAFKVADHSAKCPLIYSDEYIPFLLDYVKKNHIGAILSLFDIDIPVLANHKSDFARLGCFPLIASHRTASICNDKLQTAYFLNDAGIRSIPTYTNTEIYLNSFGCNETAFPAFVKPRWGMGSIGVLEANDELELRAAYSMVSRKVANSYLKYESSSAESVAIIQPAISGDEYGMDVVNDLQGNYRSHSVRRKLAMRAGETDVAETVVADRRFEELARSLSAKLSFPGNMDVDVFDTSEGLVVLEMNARFGGGYPFSHMAGVDLPSALVSWLRGQNESDGVLECSNPGKFMKEIELVRLEG